MNPEPLNPLPVETNRLMTGGHRPPLQSDDDGHRPTLQVEGESRLNEFEGRTAVESEAMTARQRLTDESATPAPQLDFDGQQDGGHRPPLQALQASNFPATVSKQELSDAQARANICQDFLDLIAQGSHSLRSAANLLGKPASWFSGADSMLARYKSGGTAALVRARGDDRRAGAKMGELSLMITAAEWFIPAAQWFHLRMNRTANDGSVPEAVMHTISIPAMPHWDSSLRKQLLAHLHLDELPVCPPELREAVLKRAADGKPFVTEAIARRIRNSELAVAAFRRPREAWLSKVQSPGSLHLKNDERTGEERYIQPGERFTIDDATLNFVARIPLEVPGNPCWDKFGCMIGRFQLLMIADHRSLAIPAWSYTARPKGSYRAEDLTATMHIAFQEHGVPREFALEHGISASNLVHNVLERLNVKIDHVASPHNKVIETVFNPLWTKLSHIPGSVGRFGGDEEEINKIVQRCRAGQVDPKKYFWEMPQILGAIRSVVASWNEHWVNSDRYGRWQPGAFFAREAHKNLRKFDPATSWLFSPHHTDALQVRGYLVKASVPMMPGHSMRFVFGADWLGNYDGARVKLHFNPFANACTATITLAQEWKGKSAGTVIGSADMVDRHARHGLRAYGYSDRMDEGPGVAKRHAQALRRSIVGMKTDGTIGAQQHDHRDGVGNQSTLQVNTTSSTTETTVTDRTSSTTVIDRRYSEAAPTPAVSARREDLMARQAARAERLRQMQQEI